MIIAKNIHKFYENKHILKGIDIRIEEGEIVREDYYFNPAQLPK